MEHERRDLNNTNTMSSSITTNICEMENSHIQTEIICNVVIIIKEK